MTALDPPANGYEILSHGARDGVTGSCDEWQLVARLRAAGVEASR